MGDRWLIRHNGLFHPSQNIRTEVSLVKVQKKHEIVNKCVGEWVYPIGGKDNKVGQL